MPYGEFVKRYESIHKVNFERFFAENKLKIQKIVENHYYTGILGSNTNETGAPLTRFRSENRLRMQKLL